MSQSPTIQSPLQFQALLTRQQIESLEEWPFDAVVIGAGVAGLAFALSLPDHFRVALLTKGNLGESNTRWAQGGISAALGDDDSPDLHRDDTLVAGAGLCEPTPVQTLVDGAPEAVEWLIALGARFDRDPGTGRLELGREAAHSRRRVLHAGGDATGAEVERALVAAVLSRERVQVFERAFAIDLIVAEDGSCAGCIAETETGRARLTAPVVAIAAGGAGQLWATSSNPPAATADGLAMALRAGVAVADLEFVQFHPTVLAISGSVPFLVSEAVRGEGAYLRGRDGERFMLEVHPLAELAPRDVVARGIQEEIQRHGPGAAALDLRHLDPAMIRHRFPTIAAELQERGLNLASDLIPIEPAAHYFMGGIVASPFGATTIPGLLALGEAACTGVHGANRLASNSLLEGLVFGRAAAHALPVRLVSQTSRVNMEPADIETRTDADTVDLAGCRSEVQSTMSRHVSVVRDADGLRSAQAALRAVLVRLGHQTSRKGIEATNIAQGALSIATAALLREESRGAHFRSDFPRLDPHLDGLHYVHDPAGWRLLPLHAVAPADETAEVNR